METNKRYPEKKVKAFNFLKESLNSAPLIVLIDYKGISVENINTIRRDFESQNIQYVVAKNSLIKKAVEGTEREGVQELCKGMTGVVISGEDGIAAAKTIRTIVNDKKNSNSFIVKGGFFDGTVLSSEQVLKVADLPSKEELLATLLRTVQEGPRQILGVIQGPARDLVNLLKNYENTLTESE